MLISLNNGPAFKRRRDYDFFEVAKVVPNKQVRQTSSASALKRLDIPMIIFLTPNNPVFVSYA